MAVTDKERRRVASELREAGKSHDEFDGDMIGRSIYVYLTLIKIACDPRLRMKKGVFDSLADLIEPDTTAPKCSEATPKCDRDALLALADELETDGVDCYSVSTQYVCDQYARRIRGACGVTGDA